MAFDGTQMDFIKISMTCLNSLGIWNASSSKGKLGKSLFPSILKFFLKKEHQKMENKMSKTTEPNAGQKPLTSMEKRQRDLIWRIGLVCLLSLLYIAWTLPVMLLGILVCAVIAGGVFAAEMLYAHINGSKRNAKGAVPLYLYHQWCRENMHKPVRQQWEKLKAKVNGHYAYYGITGNFRSLDTFVYLVGRQWKYWLNRRNSERSMTWEKFILL